MSEKKIISPSMTAEDLQTWMPRIAEVYLSPAIQIAFDEFLNVLIAQPRTEEQFIALLAEIVEKPTNFYELVQGHRCPLAGEWLTMEDLSRQLERSKTWIADRIQHQGQFRVRPGGGIFLHYPPSVQNALHRMRVAEDAISMAGDWLTAGEIARSVCARSRHTVVKLLNANFAHVAEKRKNLATNRFLLHYPAWVINRVRELLRSDQVKDVAQGEIAAACRYQGAGDWLAVKQIALLLNRSEQWVRRQLAANFADSGELRVNTMNRPYWYYSPEVVSRLRELAEVDRPAGDWLTIFALARALGVKSGWVEHRVTNLPLQMCQLRLDQRGYVRPHYSPDALPLLRVLAVAEHCPENSLSSGEIAKRVKGRSIPWVMDRLTELYSTPLKVVQRSSRAVTRYYPTEAVRLLQDIIDDEDILPAIPNGYLTIRQIVKAVSKDAEWVVTRLEESFPGLKRKCRGVNNCSCICYPDWTLSKLRDLSGEYSLAEGWLTIGQLAKKVGRSGPWVKKQLRLYWPGSGETRLTEPGHFSCLHYPLFIVEELEKLARIVPKAEGWATATEISVLLGVSPQTARKLLTHRFPKACELRLDSQGRTFEHWPPWVVAQLVN
ncbi:MAG TPA: hypothetical protein VJC05_04320 [Candidatus Andersenbacteria bacterium]|nr:hypothetical protein [Candidatus Andersenbacteria bacterium]